MLRRSSLLVLPFAAGCFAEPSVESPSTSGGSTSQGTTSETSASETATSSASTGPDFASSGPEGSGTGECTAGRVGCPCDEGICDNDATCIDGLCEVAIPDGCGDGERADPEECDDGNNEAGDGCSAVCTLERECFVAHLGGPAPSSIVRVYSVFSDGTMSNFDEVDVPGHNPPETGAGSNLSAASVGCLGQVYVASSTEGVLTAIRTTPEGVSVTDQAPLAAIRELACDADLGLLFATRFIPNGFAIDTFDISAGTLVADASDGYSDPSIAEVRAARLSLDRASQRAFVNFVEDGSSSIPPFFVEVDYGPGQVSIGTPTAIPVIRNNLGAVLHVAAVNQLLGVGSGSQDGPTLYRLPLSRDGFNPIVLQSDPPWNDRNNIWPLRLSTGEAGFAMGGAQGVILSAYSAMGAVEPRGGPLATALPATFARTAFDDTILVVASPVGFETYDLTQQTKTGDWTMLSALTESATPTFGSGTVVPCQ